HDADIRSWTLRLDGVTQLGAGTGPVAGGILGVLATERYTEGPHTLELTVENVSGEVAVDRVSIAIDNSPPVLSIAAPAAGALVGGTFPVFGTASDPNMLHWTLDLPDDGGAQIAWGTGSVEDALLGEWTSADLPDGTRRLRLTAVDAAGNMSTTEI